MNRLQALNKLSLDQTIRKDLRKLSLEELMFINQFVEQNIKLNEIEWRAVVYFIDETKYKNDHIIRNILIRLESYDGN